jgi:uncharacterized protein YjdB
VVAVQAGTCVITCRTQDGGYTAQCNVTVNPKGVDVTGVSVSPTTAEVEVGSTVTLRATVTPSNATNKSVSWESSDNFYATVDASGNVTGKNPGSVTIYAVSGDNTNIKGSCRVTVKAKTVAVTGVEIYKGSDKVSSSSITVNTGQPVQLTAKVLPENATNKKVTWTSADPSVITVDASGFVSAKTGTTKPVAVTVETEDGGKTATVQVTGVQLQYSITADPAKLEWAYDKTDTKSTTLTLVNIENVTAELKSGSQYFNSPALESVSGKLRLSISPKQPNTSTSPRSGTIRVTDVKDNTHYTEITVTQAARTAPYVNTLTVSPGSVTVQEKTSASDGTTANLTLEAKDQYQAAIDPGSANWYSDDTKVATVKNGVVTGVKAGSTTVYATVVNANNVTVKSNSVSVTVTQVSVAVTGISLNQSSISLDPKETEQLSATISPSDASEKGVNWSSSNKNVATVSASGLVTAVSAGDATITATAKGNANITATCNVHVRQNVTGVSIDKSTVTLSEANKTETVIVTVSPSTAENKNVNVKYEGKTLSIQKIRTDGNKHTFTISVTDNTLASLSGTINETVRFVSDSDNSKYAECNVTVNANDNALQDATLDGKTSYTVQAGDIVELNETKIKGKMKSWLGYETVNICDNKIYQYVTLTVKSGSSLGTLSKADNTFKVYANASATTGQMVISVDLTPTGVSKIFYYKPDKNIHFGDITVNVKEAATGISVPKSEYTINTGETLSVTATVVNHKDKPVTWSHSVPGIVSMTTSGNTVTLKGEAKGSTVITATCNGASASFKVIVREPDQPVELVMGLEPEVNGNQVKILATIEDEATGAQRIVDVTKDVVVTIAAGSKGKLTVTKESPSTGVYVLTVKASSDGTYYFTVKYTTAEGASDEITITVTRSGGQYTIY